MDENEVTHKGITTIVELDYELGVFHSHVSFCGHTYSVSSCSKEDCKQQVALLIEDIYDRYALAVHAISENRKAPIEKPVEFDAYGQALMPFIEEPSLKL